MVAVRKHPKNSRSPSPPLTWWCWAGGSAPLPTSSAKTTSPPSTSCPNASANSTAPSRSSPLSPWNPSLKGKREAERNGFLVPLHGRTLLIFTQQSIETALEHFARLCWQTPSRTDRSHTADCLASAGLQRENNPAGGRTHQSKVFEPSVALPKLINV